MIFPPGTTVYDGPSVLPPGECIRGEGSHRTRVILPTGLELSYADPQAPVRVEGVTLLTQAPNAGTALKITGPVLPSSVARGPQVYDVVVSGENWSAHNWTDGLHLVDCWYPQVTGFCSRGRNSRTTPFAMSSAIKSERTQGLSVEDFLIFWAQDAILQTGNIFGEGILLSDFEIVGVNRGVVLAQGGGHSMHDGHINAYWRAIELSKVQFSMHDMLLYKTHLSSQDWIGIFAHTCQQLDIHNNRINGDPRAQGATYGVVAVNVSNSNISGNLFKDFAPGWDRCGIVVGTNSANNTISENRSIGGPGVTRLNPDAGPGNLLLNNKP